MLSTLLLTFATAIVLLFISFRVEPGPGRQRTTRRVVVGAMMLLGATLTWLVALMPQDLPFSASTGRTIEWAPLGVLHPGDVVTYTHLVGNLVMLTWVGLGAPTFLPRLQWVGTVAVVASVSLVIETTQFIAPLGRVASTQDLILNVVGGALAAIGGVRLVRPWAQGTRR